MTIKKVAINTIAIELFKILEDRLHEGFKLEGVEETDVEIFKLRGIFAEQRAVKDALKDELPLFVFASYGIGMWSGTQINTPLNAGAQVIIWTRDQDYLDHFQNRNPHKNLSLYHVGASKDSNDTYYKDSDHLAQEIVKRIKASQA